MVETQYHGTDEKVAATIERHWNGIIRWHESQVNNGIL